MAPNIVSSFMQYFDSFENAVAGGDWSGVASQLTEDIRYQVHGVPFSCELVGRDAVIAGFQKSTAAFDASMDLRMLEILSLVRLGPDALRVELISGYGREAIGSVTAPVSIEASVRNGQISLLRDFYDPVLTAPALTWLGTHAAAADPSYC